MLESSGGNVTEKLPELAGAVVSGTWLPGQVAGRLLFLNQPVAVGQFSPAKSPVSVQ
jgi:hypothetical protein